jgi:HEAT repeat protein
MPAAAAEGGALLDRLAARVGAVIESTETSLDQKREAIFVLGETPGAISTLLLQSASRLFEPTLRLNAVAAMLMRNDVSGLHLAAEALLLPAEGPPSEATRNLLAGISQGVKNPQAVPALATLLRQGNDPVRRAAASALVNTASPSAIDALAQALDDGDYEVRYDAVVGLAEITGQRAWRPTRDDFRNREATYLSYWKEWRRAR